MIRRDYLLRQVQQLAQVLARALFLRTQGEYDASLKEIRWAFKALDPEIDAEGLDAQGWLDLCRRHEDVVGPLMEVVGSLLRERAASLAAAGQVRESEKARASGLTLQLEAVLTAANPLTMELLGQVDADIGALSVDALPEPALMRLVSYFEQRGRLAAAEDILFDWLARGNESAVNVGREFYGRLARLADGALVEGGLSRGEVEDGRRDLEERAVGIRAAGTAEKS